MKTTGNIIPPREAGLCRIGATLIDFVIFFVVFLVSPLAGGLIWWFCRIFFHARSGTGIGKKIFRLRLVDSTTFQHPGVMKCLSHDALWLLFYVVWLDRIFIAGHFPGDLADFLCVLAVMVVIGSLVSLGMDKKLGRTLYDYWSGTAVIRETDSDRFYVEPAE